MTILSYPVHISANGEVTPIPDWTGGETDAKIHVMLPETEEQRKAAAERNRQTEEQVQQDIPNEDGEGCCHHQVFGA